MNPYLSFRSDRYRSRWGRRIPYIFKTLLPVAICMSALGFSDEIGAYLRNADWVKHLGISQINVIILVMGILILAFDYAIIFSSVLIYWYLFADVIPKGTYGAVFLRCFRVVSMIGGSFFNIFLAEKYSRDGNEISVFEAPRRFTWVGFDCIMCWRSEGGGLSPRRRTWGARRRGTCSFGRMTKVYFKGVLPASGEYQFVAFLANLQRPLRAHGTWNGFFLSAVPSHQPGPNRQVRRDFCLDVHHHCVSAGVAGRLNSSGPGHVDRDGGGDSHEFFQLLHGLFPFLHGAFSRCDLRSKCSFADAAGQPLYVSLFPRKQFRRVPSANGMVRSFSMMLGTAAAAVFIKFFVTRFGIKGDSYGFHLASDFPGGRLRLHVRTCIYWQKLWGGEFRLMTRKKFSSSKLRLEQAWEDLTQKIIPRRSRCPTLPQR